MKRFYELCAFCMICMFVASCDVKAAMIRPSDRPSAAGVLNKYAESLSKEQHDELFSTHSSTFYTNSSSDAADLLCQHVESLSNERINALAPEQVALLFNLSPFLFSPDQIRSFNEAQILKIEKSDCLKIGTVHIAKAPVFRTPGWYGSEHRQAFEARVMNIIAAKYSSKNVTETEKK
ncbi:hypothetical protein FACS189449_03520 [Alphaproteobacteria bacterium]|nr:hypothetical protein FACS189449_03520 [Alphaproteobacteria bacterium]